MKCSNCSAEVTHAMKFCAECGAATGNDNTGVARSKVTHDWLLQTLEISGFLCERSEGAEGPTIVATRNDCPSLDIVINSAQTLITIMARWKMSRPSWARKSSFLASLNSANSKNWVVTFFSPEPHEILIASSAMWIGESTAMSDVIAYVEMFASGAQNAITASGLIEFA